jgi:alcohol dehydrogenase
MYEYFQFYSPTKVIFGIGSSSDFAGEVAGFGAKGVLVVSDKGVASHGILDRILGQITSRGMEVIGPYLDVKKDAPISVVNDLAQFGSRHGVDAIVAVGGGSVIDTAKAANILITHGGDLMRDYAGVQTIPSSLKPLVVVPTTAGTGSEVTSVAVVLDDKAGVKHSFVDDFLKPNVAILDPELTLSMPPHLTSATAVDAFSHALEAFTSNMRSPISDGLALEALYIIKKHLIPALSDPMNLELRSKLMVAATLAGMAFDNAMVGVVHGIAHAIGAIFGISHGEAVFLALPIGVSYNMDAAKERYAEVAMRLSISGEACEDLGASAFFDWLSSWRREISRKAGLALSLSEKGFGREKLDRVARLAAADGTSFYNPREVDKEELLRYLLKYY